MASLEDVDDVLLIRSLFFSLSLLASFALNLGQNYGLSILMDHAREKLPLQCDEVVNSVDLARSDALVIIYAQHVKRENLTASMEPNPAKADREDLSPSRFPVRFEDRRPLEILDMRLCIRKP